MNCINYLTIVSTSDYDIIRELKHIPKLVIIKTSDQAIRVRFPSATPDFDFLTSLYTRYNHWWIKNEWLSNDGRAGIWISDGTNYEWEDLSLDDDHYVFS